jgi:DNA-binding transcriptional LysR family regulator
MSNTISSIDLIAAFEAVMSKGSLSAAARQLGRSQPTVRRQIETLETDLGVALFTRSGNSLQSTALAETLLPQAQSVISGTYAFARTASGDASTATGPVRIT